MPRGELVPYDSQSRQLVPFLFGNLGRSTGLPRETGSGSFTCLTSTAVSLRRSSPSCNSCRYQETVLPRRPLFTDCWRKQAGPRILADNSGRKTAVSILFSYFFAFQSLLVSRGVFAEFSAVGRAGHGPAKLAACQQSHAEHEGRNLRQERLPPCS